MATDTDVAKSQARAQLESIRKLAAALETADNNGTEEERDEARQAITEDALSVEVRSDWHEAGTTGENTEYSIMLCIGGPAVRIRGSLGLGGEPESAGLEYLDWGTPWEALWLSAEEEADVLTYARTFYFGE